MDVSDRWRFNISENHCNETKGLIGILRARPASRSLRLHEMAL